MSEIDRFNEVIRKNARFWVEAGNFEDIFSLNFQPAYTPCAIHMSTTTPFTEAMKSVSEPEPKEARVRARLAGEYTGTCYMCARKGQFLSRLRDDNRIICEDCAYEHLT